MAERDDRVVAREPAYVDERTSATRHDGWNGALRTLGVAAGAVAAIIAVVALIRIDWNAGFDSAPVDVIGIAFTPTVAVVTLVAALIAIFAAASPDRGSKLAVGAILVVVGVAILVAGDSARSDFDVEDGHGWMAVIVGAIVLLGGILMRTAWTARRRVRTGGV
jgi:hypothetical protein